MSVLPLSWVALALCVACVAAARLEPRGPVPVANTTNATAWAEATRAYQLRSAETDAALMRLATRVDALTCNFYRSALELSCHFAKAPEPCRIALETLARAPVCGAWPSNEPGSH